jgi:hypothetical protein
MAPPADADGEKTAFAPPGRGRGAANGFSLLDQSAIPDYRVEDRGCRIMVSTEASQASGGGSIPLTRFSRQITLQKSTAMKSSGWRAGN